MQIDTQEMGAVLVTLSAFQKKMIGCSLILMVGILSVVVHLNKRGNSITIPVSSDMGNIGMGWATCIGNLSPVDLHQVKKCC